MSEESSAIDRLAGTLANALATRANPESVQALEGHGAMDPISLLTDVTTFNDDGSGDLTSTLAAGTEGQVKRLTYVHNGGDQVFITVTNLLGGTTITFSADGDTITLQYLRAKWTRVSAAIGAVIS